MGYTGKTNTNEDDMGTALLRLMDGETEWWLEWSTVVDAPVTYGMTEAQLGEHIMTTQGSDGLGRLSRRMEVARSRGGLASTSFLDYERDVDHNRAGAKETSITIAQLIDVYCHRKPNIFGMTWCKNCEGEGCGNCTDGMAPHARFGEQE